MHEDVCDAVNSLRASFNTFPIRSGKDVKDRNLERLKYEWKNENPELREVLDPADPFVIVDTDRIANASEQRVFGGSITNAAEADLAARLAKAFHESFVLPGGEHLMPVILSPYSAQVGEISARLPEQLRNQCMTIYRAQGQEFPCVLVSFVRSNPSGNIGFLQEAELRAQTYVGCSRAQAKLVLLFSTNTFLGHGHMDFERLHQTRSGKLIDAMA
jgi:superfamily I DNA/RNA helicase